MNMQKPAANQRRAAREARNRKLRLALAVCVMAMLFVQITFAAQLHAKAKEIALVEAQIHELEGQKESLQVYLSMYQSIDRIRTRAEQLGMRLPDETQIRVVSGPGAAADTFAQTAENTAVETSMR